MKSAHTKIQGFTLVELAVSLVVIGLLIAVGASLVGTLMVAVKVRESKETIGGVMESVNSWAAGNNTLPDTSATPTGFTNIAKSPNDSWGRPFIYLYDANLQKAAPTKDTICGRRSTFITLTDTNTGAIIQNVAYLVLSQGDDAATDTTIGGVAVTSEARAAATAVTADTVNDIVRWVTLDELRTKIGCQGAQLKIVNNELPYGYVGSAYSATISADGGYRTGANFKWCVETSQNIFQLEGGLTINGTAGTVGTNPAGVKTACTLADAISSQALSIGGTPAATVNATSQLSIYLWDDNANSAKKPFALTINPQ